MAIELAVEPSAVPPYQLRVMTERAELDFRTTALYNFIKDGQPFQVDADEYARLLTQYRVMKLYSEILGERIANFHTN